MKYLFSAIRSSIYDPIYYRTLYERPLKYSLKYYTGFILMLAVFLTIILSIPLVVGLSGSLRDFSTKFFAYFPDDTSVTIQNGIATTSISGPQFLPISSSVSSAIGESPDNITNFLVIDVASPFSDVQFADYQSLMWVRERELVYKDRSGEITHAPFNSEFNFVLNEAELHKIFDAVEPYYPLAGPLVVLVIFTGSFLLFATNFAYLLFTALFILVLGRMMKKRWTYGQSYQIGLHAMTLPVLITVALAIFNITMNSELLLSTTIMLAVVFYNFNNGTPINTEILATTPEK